MDIEVGDTIRVVYIDQASFSQQETKIEGKVEVIFDALTSDLQPNINLFIDIRTKRGGWFRYKPAIDGGTVTIISKGKR